MASEVEKLLQPAEVADPRIGTTLSGRYELVRRIGEGGMGSVYEARHLVIEKTVAVKLLRSDLATNAEQVARFRREATAAAAIGHPNIIDVLDMGRADDGSVYLVMERLVGQDWSDALGEREADLPEILPVLDQVLDGLGAAHAAGILHRDLKPANVFVCDDGAVKLLDFGVSKVLDSTALSTHTGVAMGTPVFMSPEQVRDSKHVDHRTDLYAVGVMLFYALTGRYPFEGATVPELAYKIVADPVPSLRALRPELPEPVTALVERLLAKEPDERPSSCAEVKAALAAAARGEVWTEEMVAAATMPATPSMAPAPEEIERRGEARRTEAADAPSPGSAEARGRGAIGAVAGGALLVGALVLGGVAYFSDADPDPVIEEVSDPPPSGQRADLEAPDPESAPSPPAGIDPGDVVEPEADPSQPDPEPERSTEGRDSSRRSGRRAPERSQDEEETAPVRVEPPESNEDSDTADPPVDAPEDPPDIQGHGLDLTQPAGAR